MKRIFMLVPLLVLAPLGFFLSFYCEGAGYLPDQTALPLALASTLVLPWFVSARFLIVYRGAWPMRVGLFVGTLVVQIYLSFTIIPPGAKTEMMGTAHRLRRQFDPAELAECAEAIRRKHREGLLATNVVEVTYRSPVSERSVGVADSELPDALRGKFQWVAIDSTIGVDVEPVYFALDGFEGIVCDDRPESRGAHFYSLAKGVHAYRYMRP